MKKEFKTFFRNSQLLDTSISKIKKIPWILGKNAFLFILIFVLLEIIFVEFLFYNYVILVKTQEPTTIDTPAKFKEYLYKSVLKEMQDRENIFENPLQKNYNNPFL